MNTNDVARIIALLDRIATALERQADVDPLAMIDAAMKDGELLPDAGAVLASQTIAPAAPFAGNGMTVLYKHPGDPKLHIVARRDRNADGGYTVGVEPA